MEKNPAKRKKVHKTKIQRQVFFIFILIFIIGFLVYFSFGHGVQQYLVEDFRHQVLTQYPSSPSHIVTSPQPSPFHMPTITLAPFDTSNCTKEGSFNAIQNVLEPNTTRPGGVNISDAKNAWENDHYLIALIQRHDLIQSTNPSFYIYASRCTKDYLSLGFMGGGIFIDLVNADGTMQNWTYPNNEADFDTAEFATNLPMPEDMTENEGIDWKILDAQATISDFKDDPGHSNADKGGIAGYYVIVSLGDTSFPATFVSDQINRKKDGMLYEQIYSYFGKVTAIAKYNIKGQLLSLEKF